MSLLPARRVLFQGGVGVVCAFLLASSAISQPIDTCATAQQVIFASGSWPTIPNLTVNAADPDDHFRGTLSPGFEAKFRVRFAHQDGNVDLRIWNSDCSILLASSASTTDDELATWINMTQVPVEVVCEVFLNGTGNVEYDFAYRADVSNCAMGDDWEPNDSCASPRVLPFTTGLYKPDRTVQAGADDYYEITVPAYAQLEMVIGNGTNSENIDAQLYDAGCATLLETSSTQGAEYLDLDNNSAVPRTFVIRIYLVAGACASYVFTLSGQPGTNYCTSLQNTSGYPAVISGSQSTSVSSGLFRISAINLPYKVPAIFFYGPNAINVPFGNGIRCVGTPFARSPAFQSYKYSVAWSFSAANQSSSAVPILAGSTYNFQCWFRDPWAGGSAFNLSDGYRVQFTP